MESQAVLRVNDLKKSFAKPWSRARVEAVKGISFSVPPGSITGFLGANGAGKTTTIKCLLQLAFADSGDMEFFGQNGLTAESKAKIGFLPERPYFYEYLTGREFLNFYGVLSVRLSKNELRDRVKKLLARVGLEHAADRPLRSYCSSSDSSSAVDHFR
jgi:ABC-2 type transport system ATP-binding protein